MLPAVHAPYQIHCFKFTSSSVYICRTSVLCGIYVSVYIEVSFSALQVFIALVFHNHCGGACNLEAGATVLLHCSLCAAMLHQTQHSYYTIRFASMCRLSQAMHSVYMRWISKDPCNLQTWVVSPGRPATSFALETHIHSMMCSNHTRPLFWYMLPYVGAENLCSLSLAMPGTRREAHPVKA